MRAPSFAERQQRKHARSARVKSAFTRLQNRATTRTTRAREREKRETKRIERTRILLKNDDDDDDDIARAPALASFCATNNPSNGPFRCHWRTLARFSIASSAASSNRKRQYACGLIDCSIDGRECGLIFNPSALSLALCLLSLSAPLFLFFLSFFLSFFFLFFFLFFFFFFFFSSFFLFFFRSLV